MRGWGTRELAEEMIRDDSPRSWGTDASSSGSSAICACPPGQGRLRAEWRNFAAWDIRDVLPAIRIPTLVIQRIDWPGLNIEDGRFLASRIPDARLVQLPGKRRSTVLRRYDSPSGRS